MVPKPLSSKNTYQDPALSTPKRVKDLLSRMTLEEKVAQMSARWVYDIVEGRSFSRDKAEVTLRIGVGGISRIGGWSSLDAKQNADVANAIQNFLVSSTRLGIPALIHDECCAGYLAFGATIFPQPIGLASTWAPELIEEMTTIIRNQMLAVGTRQGLAPVLDISRDPRWGRVEETFGEDSYLVSEMGTAYVKGLQGEDLQTGVMATGKHFVGHGMSEGGLNAAPAHISSRELAEVFLVPFSATIQEANLASIMPAIHEIDGVPMSSSRELVTKLLRQRLGFSGLIVSDYEAIRFLVDLHHIAQDKVEAARYALNAGISMELHFPDCYAEPLKQALQAGLIREAEVDNAVAEVLAAKFKLGLFEKPYVDSDQTMSVFTAPKNRILARELACKSIVLLKNAGNLLPLSYDVKRIAVIGPNADEPRHMLGDYSHMAHVEEQLMNNPLAQGCLDKHEKAPAITVLEGIRHKLGHASELLYTKGCNLNDDSRDGFVEAIALAKQAEVTVLVLGDRSGLTKDCTSGETRDNADLRLPGAQEELVHSIAKIGKPLVIVLVSGRVHFLSSIIEESGAVVQAWVPGEEGGNAVADVLFGDVNPAGRLPITFPRSSGQIPIYYGHKATGGHSHWHKDYTLLSSKPLFPFGYGLSYSRFYYDSLAVSPLRLEAGGKVCIRFTVSNVGDFDGEEVSQLYIRDLVATVTRPVKELKGYKRVFLKRGQAVAVTFTLDSSQFGLIDASMNYVVEPGMYEVMVGGSSDDIRLVGEFEFLGNVPFVPKHREFFSSVEVHSLDVID